VASPSSSSLASWSLQSLAHDADSEAHGEIVYADWRRLLSAVLGAATTDMDENRVSPLSDVLDRPVRRSTHWVGDDGAVSLMLQTGIRGTWEVVVLATGPGDGRDMVLEWHGSPSYRTMVSEHSSCPERGLYEANEPMVNGMPDAILEFTVLRDGTISELSVAESADPRFAAAVMGGLAQLEVDQGAFGDVEFPYTHRVKFPFTLKDPN
jgi:hypothetical protein